MVYGSGFPFGPPGNYELRQSFQGGDYKRVDVGFSKIIYFDSHFTDNNGLKSIWIGAEILNLIAANNVISYLWIQDVGGNFYAIPNNLSQRFLNVRVQARF